MPLITSLLTSLCFRSADNDDATKRKVNLVFEKIQTLKSRAAGKTPVNFYLFFNVWAYFIVMQCSSSALEV